MLDALIEAGVISSSLTSQDFALLQGFGILKSALKYEASSIRLEDGTHILANLRTSMPEMRSGGVVLALVCNRDISRMPVFSLVHESSMTLSARWIGLNVNRSA